MPKGNPKPTHGRVLNVEREQFMDELKWARRVLGVPAHATREQVRGAFRTAAKLHHPDTGGCSARFAELRRAYEVAFSGAQLTPMTERTAQYVRSPVPAGTSAPRLPQREPFTTTHGAHGGSRRSRSFADLLAQHMGYA